MTAKHSNSDDEDTMNNGTTVEAAGNQAGEMNSGIRIREVERIFSLVEEALETEGLDTQETRQLVSVLERAMAAPAETDPEMIAEFVTMLEELLLDPDDLDGADIDGVLTVFEQALASTMTEEEHSEDIFSVVEAAVRDPTSLTPEDVERFSSGIERSIVDFTDPTGGFGTFWGAAESSDIDPENIDDEVLDSFKIARLAAGMTQRATGYSLESGVRAGTRMGYAAMNAQSPSELVTEARAITLDELRRSGVDIGQDQAEWLDTHQDELTDDRPLSKEQLQAKGERLLSKSAEVGRDEAFHPAYPSVLRDLAADEARIIRLLAADGLQPCMDVYDKQYIPFTSTLVAQNLSKIGNDAGCRHPQRTPIYLQNLERLGLIRFSNEPVENLKAYQVLDAQPHIETAIEKAKRPKTDYKSIQLTEMGIDFCETCLPVELNHKRQRKRFRGEKPDSATE